MKQANRRMALVFLVAMGAGCVAAQTVPSAPGLTPQVPIARRTAAQLEAQAKILMEQSRQAANGNVSVTLEKYPDHYTMLSTRVKSGGAEQHAYWNDIFVVLDGEATELTGGSIIDGTTNATTGETRGSRLEGAKATPMRKGDVIHILPGTPHQTVLESGKTFTYYVIKVAAPNAPVQ